MGSGSMLVPCCACACPSLCLRPGLVCVLCVAQPKTAGAAARCLVGALALSHRNPTASSAAPPPPPSAGSAARPLADAVLAQAAAAAEAEGEAADARLPAMQRLLRTLDLRCPEALDAAVNAALPAGSQAVKGEVGEAAAAAAQRVLAALNAAFEGTARCPLLEAGTTVMLAAEAPAAAMRLLVRPFFFFVCV